MKKKDTKTKDSKPHYALLDGLRGVAALLVVWYHIFEGFQFAGNKPVIDFINHGYLAVDFFFILSGFVVGYAYDNRWGKTLTLGGFFRRRLIRLQPMVIMGAVFGSPFSPSSVDALCSLPYPECHVRYAATARCFR